MRRSAFELSDVRYDYPDLLKLLRKNGTRTAPRGEETLEMLDVVMVLDPHYPLVTGINRGISTKLISMEALQLISGLSYANRTVKAAPNMSRFLDGEVFHGAYGPRIAPQIEAAINKLKSDADSRQALMTVWNPMYDLLGIAQPRDIPCTALIQLFIRNDKLVMHTTMRSNDAWWGTPHDWGQFTQLMLTIASIMDIEAGDYYHHAVSWHLYERDFDKIDELTVPTGPQVEMGSIYTNNSLHDARIRAKLMIEMPDKVVPFNTTEDWHVKQQLAIDAC